MSIQTELFGKLPHNKSAYLYTIKISMECLLKFLIMVLY